MIRGLETDRTLFQPVLTDFTIALDFIGPAHRLTCMDIDFAMFDLPTRSAEESVVRRELRDEQAARARQAHVEALATGATPDAARQAAAEAAAGVVVAGKSARILGAMAALNGKVRGLVIAHRDNAISLFPEDDGTWSASGWTDGLEVELQEVEGSGPTPLAAADDCVNAIEVAEGSVDEEDEDA